MAKKSINSTEPVAWQLAPHEPAEWRLASPELLELLRSNLTVYSETCPAGYRPSLIDLPDAQGRPAWDRILTDDEEDAVCEFAKELMRIGSGCTTEADWRAAIEEELAKR